MNPAARRSAYELYLEGCRFDEDPQTMERAAEAYVAALRLDPALSCAITNLGNLRYRIGAVDQLRIYGRILNAPVFAIRSEIDFASTLVELRARHLQPIGGRHDALTGVGEYHGVGFELRKLGLQINELLLERRMAAGEDDADFRAAGRVQRPVE